MTTPSARRSGALNPGAAAPSKTVIRRRPAPLHTLNRAAAVYTVGTSFYTGQGVPAPADPSRRHYSGAAVGAGLVLGLNSFQRPRAATSDRYPLPHRWDRGR